MCRRRRSSTCSAEAGAPFAPCQYHSGVSSCHRSVCPRTFIPRRSAKSTIRSAPEKSKRPSAGCRRGGFIAFSATTLLKCHRRRAPSAESSCAGSTAAPTGKRSANLAASEGWREISGGMRSMPMSVQPLTASVINARIARCPYRIRIIPMKSSRLVRAFAASAVVLLSQIPAALGADECRCAANASRAGARLLGIDYAGTRLDEIGRLRSEDLLGALKMSGTWVSKLRPDAFMRTAALACRYAADRRQDFYLQVPTNYASRDIVAALEKLASGGCRPAGVAIGNE